MVFRRPDFVFNRLFCSAAWAAECFHDGPLFGLSVVKNKHNDTTVIITVFSSGTVSA
jgi:hypothetical protein